MRRSVAARIARAYVRIGAAVDLVQAIRRRDIGRAWICLGDLRRGLR